MTLTDLEEDESQFARDHKLLENLLLLLMCMTLKSNWARIRVLELFLFADIMVKLDITSGISWR